MQEAKKKKKKMTDDVSDKGSFSKVKYKHSPSIFKFFQQLTAVLH